MTIKEFIYGTFSEPGVGGPSFARVATGLLTLAAIAWVSYVVVKSHALPPNPQLSDLAIFVMSLYGANKFSTAITSFSSSTVKKV